MGIADIMKYWGRAALALLFSAVSFASCRGGGKSEELNPETLVTLRSDTLTMVVSRDGLKSYCFSTLVQEYYGQATEPYSRYPEGVYVEKYKDSTEMVESTLRANEAINYEKRDLWMATGDVVATGSGLTMYTEQLFWDAKTDRIYSYVGVRVVDADGEHFGEGFESDSQLQHWVFQDYIGSMAVDTTPMEEEPAEADPEAAADDGAEARAEE